MATEKDKPKQKRFRWPKGETRAVHFNVDKKLVNDFLLVCQMEGMSLAEGIRQGMRTLVHQRKQSEGGLR